MVVRGTPVSFAMIEIHHSENALQHQRFQQEYGVERMI
jgi:hypothetical protein